MKKIENPEVAVRIRNLLLACDLKITHSQGRWRIADSDVALYSSLKGKKNQQRAIEAKAVREAYAASIRNLSQIKEDVEKTLEWCLRGYSDTYQRIWIGAFLESKTVEELSKESGYSSIRVKEILGMFRKDLREAENG